jgi:hypothetical protein
VCVCVCVAVLTKVTLVYVTVLYTVGVLSSLSCSPDDGHNDARNMFSHQ